MCAVTYCSYAPLRKHPNLHTIQQKSIFTVSSRTALTPFSQTYSKLKRNSVLKYAPLRKHPNLHTIQQKSIFIANIFCFTHTFKTVYQYTLYYLSYRPQSAGIGSL